MKGRNVMNNMNFEEFELQIQNLLRESDSNLDIQIQGVSKNNGIQYTGLACRNINTAVSPVIYMEPYFRMFDDGKDIHSIVDEVLRIVRSNQLDFDAKSIYEFDMLKERIIYAVINKSRNRDLLERIPYRVFNDELVITYKIMLDNVVDGSATLQVNNEILKIWNVSEEDLWQQATNNTPIIKKPVMNSMLEVLLRIKGLDNDEDFKRLLDGCYGLDTGMYVLSNSDGINGASVIVDKQFMDDVYSKIGKCYILPSSLHEVIVIPYTEDIDVDYLNSMISEVNNTQVEAVEVLGDRAMLFDGNGISIA